MEVFHLYRDNQLLEYGASFRQACTRVSQERARNPLLFPLVEVLARLDDGQLRRLTGAEFLRGCPGSTTVTSS